MKINVTFDCECGSFVDQNIDVIGWDDFKGTERGYYHQVFCDGCGMGYDVRVCEHGMGEVFNLDWPPVDSKQDLKEIGPSVRQQDELDKELTWVIRSTTQRGTYNSVINDVVALIKTDVKIPNTSTLYNMAYAQVVTAVEAYLSGLFIHKVVNSAQLIRNLVESNPEFAKRQLPLKEIFFRWEGLQLEVARYLQDLIFHDLKKIKPMYKDVLGYDLGEIPWLFQAVRLRHDCVHRNGTDKQGNPTEIDIETIQILIKKCNHLIACIDTVVSTIITQPAAPTAALFENGKRDA